MQYLKKLRTIGLILIAMLMLLFRLSGANSMAGFDSQILYASGQGGFAGLDQANLRIPRNLAGRGEVEIEVEVEGKKANKVKVHIR